MVGVLSPSDTFSEIQDKEKLCLENGCREFWIVNIDRRRATISTADGSGRTCRSGRQIPLSLFPGQTIEADAIFSDL